jgi:hypothetical protein
VRLVARPSTALAAVVAVALASSLMACDPAAATGDRPDAAGAVEVPDDEPPADLADIRGVTEVPVADADGVETTLEAISAALRDADPEAVQGWLLDPDDEVGARWADRARNLEQVPLASYELTLDREMPAMTSERVRERWGDDAQLVLVAEEHALEGHDADGPRRDQLALTFVPHEGRWLLADDRGGGNLGLVRGVQLWDLGPVAATRRGPLLALHRPGAGGVDQLLDEATSALALAEERWPLPWSGGVPLLVPADVDELTELLNVTFSLDEFIAFATATPLVGPHEHRLTGSRVVLNPDRFGGRDPATRELVLVHELLHVASRPYSTATTPLWIEEGVAQVLGEQRSSTGTRLLDAAGPAGRRLPTDAEFTTGGRDGIHLAYQRSWGFTDHLVGRFGADAFARFYETVGVGSVQEPGTVRHRVDRAAVEVFGEPLDDLLDDWRAAG